jgi:hypothetical protein
MSSIKKCHKCNYVRGGLFPNTLYTIEFVRKLSDNKRRVSLNNTRKWIVQDWRRVNPAIEYCTKTNTVMESHLYEIYGIQHHDSQHTKQSPARPIIPPPPLPIIHRNSTIPPPLVITKPLPQPPRRLPSLRQNTPTPSSQL